MLWNPRPRWTDTELGLDTAGDVAEGSIGVAPEKLDETLRTRRRIQVRVQGDRGPGLILRRIPEKARPSVRLFADDAATLRSAVGAGARSGTLRLQAAAPTWWTTLRGLPGPSTTLAVATLVTALLVAAPLVVGKPPDPGRTATAALVEVRAVEDDVDALPALGRRLGSTVRELPPGPARTDGRRAVAELQDRADRLVAWQAALDARADRAPDVDPWDVAAKLAALITAVLSFVVAYRGLRPGG